MKKILMLVSVLILGFSLTGCTSLFGDTETTTTTEAIIVDTDNIIDISTVSALQTIEMNKSYRLTADIDLSDEEWIPLGDYSLPFMGNFDGNGHTISNLTITTDYLYSGLFGKVSGNITDLNCENFSIVYETDFLTYAGLVAGFTDGNIDNVTVDGSIDITNTGMNSYVGLLIGFSQGPLDNLTLASEFLPNVISNNTVTGTVLLDSDNIAFVGGMIGKTFNSNVTDNFANTDVSVSLHDYFGYVGGFIGDNYGGILIGFEEDVDDSNIYIENNVSISVIDVTIEQNDVSIGGFIGYNHSGYNRDNYSETDLTVSGTNLETTEVNVGGYIGENWNSVVMNTVTVYSYTENLETDFVNNNILFMIGQNFSEADFLNNYVACLTEDIDTTTVAGLTEISATDYESNTFFQDSLSWETEQINKILN
ncbi:MAG: hypothetical protein JEZ05_04560 [Tenericutes bacterium]|nr:hypothetical protein [Mycoplasmatota bacterium]